MDDINFCPACGKNVSPGTLFCPACGMRLNAAEGRGTVVTKYTTATDGVPAGRAKIAAALLLINAAILFLFAFFILTSAAELAQEMFDMPIFADLYTVEEMTELIRQIGMASAAGGAVGVIAAVLALMRRLWVAAIILCLMSASVGLMSLIGVVLGLIAFWMLLKARPVFRD